MRLTGSVNFGFGRKADRWIGLLLCAVLFAWARLRARLGGPPIPGLWETTPPRSETPLPTPKRILAIKFYGLGNMALALPVVGALRREFPDAELDFLTLEGNSVVLERSGVVTRTLTVQVGGYGSLLKSLWTAFRELRRRRYDLVVDLEQFIKLSSILAYLSGAPERIGFNTDGQRRGWLYTTRVVYTDSDHTTRIFMRLLRPLGIRDEERGIQLRTEAAEEARVGELLREHGVGPDRAPLVCVHVGSGLNFYDIALKRWPLAGFVEVADALAERHGAVIAFTGTGAEERALVREARSQMKGASIDLVDAVSVGELLALLRRATFTLCNDTSVMHLSAAVGTPVAAIFGPTNPLHYGPLHDGSLIFYRDLHCSPCLTNYNLKVSYCSNPVCVRQISPAEVLAGIERSFLDPETPRHAGIA